MENNISINIIQHLSTHFAYLNAFIQDVAHIFHFKPISICISVLSFFFVAGFHGAHNAPGKRMLHTHTHMHYANGDTEADGEKYV